MAFQLNQKASEGMKQDISEFDRLKKKNITVKRPPRKFNQQNR